MTELEAPEVGENTPPYMIFLVVFLFFLTGLLGFLICHLLKKKGYHCRTRDIDEDEEEEEKIGGNAEDDDEENQDTVEQILKCILENEANMEAFNEMLGNYNICARHDPRLRKDSVSCVPPHHHTVHSDSDHNTCHLCAQSRSKKGRRQSRTPRFKQRPGEQTVFSVGRFRVTHTDKKLYGGPHALVSSGDQLDRSQDSNEKKESGYTLRNMFKDTQPPESTNVGKRRKSVGIFGLRRGSDPVGVKGREEIGSENRAVKFAKSGENNGIVPTRGTEPSTKTEPQTSPKIASVMPQHEADKASSPNSPSGQSRKQAAVARSAPDDPSEHGSRPAVCTNLTSKPSIGSMVTSHPGSLLLPSPTWSRHTHNTAEKQACIRDNALKDPFEPLQSSTPIGPFPVSIPGLPPVIPMDPVSQTTPDVSSSPSSSSLPSHPVQAQPSSPSAATESPKLTNTASVKAALCPAISPSPKLLLPGTLSSQSPGSSSSLLEGLGTLQALPHVPIFSASPKTDTKSVSLQTPSPSPAAQKPCFRSLPLSPTSPLFPSSPVSSRVGSVTMVKASPDSNRVFSVVTMVEEEISSMKEQEQKMKDCSPALDQGKDASALGNTQPKDQREERSVAEGRLTSYQDKWDKTEVGDTRNGKVMQEQEAGKLEEEMEKTEHSHSKQ